MSKDIVQQLDPIDRAILSALGDNDEWCYPYKYLERITGYDREVLKPHVKKLRELNLVKYERGLMTEDGEVAGSGFCVNYQNWRELRDVVEATPEHQRNRLSDIIDDFKSGYKTKTDVMNQVDRYIAVQLGAFPKYGNYGKVSEEE